MFLVLSLLVLATATARASDCIGTVSSLSDIPAAVRCSTVNINPFTVPAGEQFTLPLVNGSVVNMQGNVAFGNKSWTGPMFLISGSDITFNGNGYSFDGGGPFYWDGLGSNGGTIKPRPMLRIEMSGTFKDLNVINSPCQTFSVGSNPGPVLIDGVVVDDSQGDYPNANSSGLPAGHNTDGFDVSTNNLVIQNSVVKNQDDCLAINQGTNIVFRSNACSGGHGISIGSITSNKTVSDILVEGNTITNSAQALRIKTDAAATNSLVSNVTYSRNTASGISGYGVLITQSYPATLGSPAPGVKLSDISITGPTTSITVNSSAERVAVNCGSGGCLGTWDWSSLRVSGGKAGPMNNFTGIVGYSE